MKILALSPHTDDAELAAGASLARWLEEGHNIHVVALSTGDSESGATEVEFIASMGVLGIGSYETYEFPCHHFPECRQEIQNFEQRRRNMKQ